MAQRKPVFWHFYTVKVKAKISPIVFLVKPSTLKIALACKSLSAQLYKVKKQFFERKLEFILYLRIFVVTLRELK